MANQHFFKPLLPGFHSHLTIPMAFFLKNIHGRNEQKTALLRSNASDITWKVKIDGQRLTNGWKEFALAHDLRIGDILVFKQDRYMSFHVTMLGPSCCEIQYVNDQNNLGKIQRKKKKAESSSQDLSCFVANVTPSNLRYDSLTFPMSFVRANGVDTRSGEMILMNEKGRSWTVDLKRKNSCGTTYIRRGWRSFCHANGLRAGDFFTFKLIQRGETLCLRLSSRELEEEDCLSEANAVKGNLRWNASSSPSQNRFMTVTLTNYNIGQSTLVLPIPFTRVNGLEKAKKISLLDKNGVKWSTKMSFEVQRKRMKLFGGWKEFCNANGVKIGESIILELIWDTDHKSSVLTFYSKVMPQPK